MVATKIASGIHTAIVTPFLTDGGIDWGAFERLLKRQERAGVAGVVVFGTTGEGPTITVQEKLTLIRKARAQLGSGVQVMAATGGNNTAACVELALLAEEAGANSLLIVTPPYNKPSLLGLEAHYNAISQKVKLPICLYHVPSRTAQALTPEGINHLCKNPQITAVKEASGDVALFAQAKAGSAAKFLSGDDPSYLASLACGGEGAISVISNIFPRAMVAMTEAFLCGDNQKALSYNKILLPLMKGIFLETNPMPIKAVLEIEGLCQNELRLPLVPVKSETYGKLKILVAETKELLSQQGVLDDEG